MGVCTLCEDWSSYWSKEQIQITACSTLPARCLIIFDLVSLSLPDVSAACLLRCFTSLAQLVDNTQELHQFAY